MKFSFILEKKDKSSRIGTIQTAHGEIHTPIFMPVGTRASVKSLTNDLIESTGAEIILGNTYHLMLRPGENLIEKLGGLHKFMNWNRPILTDSGGFQVMSLANMRKISENGVKFRSHIDGKIEFLDAERSMDIQRKLDADITMIFDECTPFPYPYNKTKNSMLRSLRWAERSKKAFVKRDGYGLFGIVQGSIYEDLRQLSAKELINMNFDGYAMGGVMGSTQKDMFDVLNYTADLLPENKPRYLMGVGKPSDLLGAIYRGVDMFDCIMPSRNARNGQAFTRNGEIKIKNSKYSEDISPLDEKCQCYTCKNHSKAYIHHLARVNEMLASTLMTVHNLTFYLDLVKSARKLIISEKFNDTYEQFLYDGEYGFMNEL